MDELENQPKRPSFENFKSVICHRVHEMGDVPFVIDILERDSIRNCYNRQWFPEALYLLAMLDYLSRKNNVPICDAYDDLRRCKLEKPIYPASIRVLSAAAGNDEALKKAEQDSIPEFLRFNIIESDIRDVV